MAILSLAQLRQMAREQADMVNSTFITDAELTRIINRRLVRLHDYQVQAGENYYLKTQTYTTTPNVDTYALPADFFRVRGVDYFFGTDSTRRLTADKFEYKERNRWIVPRLVNQYRGKYRYAIWANNFVVRPFPSDVFTFLFNYEPRFQYLVLDTDTFDFVEGWEDFAILPAVIYMINKEEGDASQWAAAYAEIKKEINDSLSERTQGPSRIVEVDNYYVNVYGEEREIF